MTPTPKNIHARNLADTVIRNLEKRRMVGYYCESATEAVDKILSLMPEGSSIGWGGSMTLSEVGLMDALHADPDRYRLLVREDAKTLEEAREVFAKILSCGYFLMSTNAITVDGELVNIDGRGNRVSYLCYGPENVIVVAGMNKVTADVDSALARIRTVAAPTNAVRLNRKTPCAATGKCENCLSPDCICAQTVITRLSQIPNRIKVILVGEDLGY